MPSGSRRGGSHGGSHFSGGSNGGNGGSHFNRNNNNRNNNNRNRRIIVTSPMLRPRRFVRPMHIRFGSTRYVVKEKASVAVRLLSILFLVAIIALFVAFGVRSNAGTQISIIEQDYAYYQSMVDRAEQNSAYKTTGWITGSGYNPTAGKYYLTYSFLAQDGSEVEGETFAVYTAEEINAFEIYDPIELAVNSQVITFMTDSMPMDYAEMSIEQDGEYTHYIGQRKGATTGLIVCAVLGGGAIIIAVIVAIANKQKEDEKSAQTIQTNQSNNTIGSAQTSNVCAYCGSELAEGVTKCPSCGAKRKLKK